MQIWSKVNSFFGRLFSPGGTVLARRLVTVDIDEAVVRIVQFRGTRVEKWVTVPLEQPGSGGDSTRNSDHLASKIREAFKAHGIVKQNVIAGMSGLYAVTRVITMPHQTRDTLNQQTVTNAAKNLMPLDINDLYIAYQPVSSSDEGRQVIVTGVPKDIMDYDVRALREAAISPYSMDLRPMALARFVGRDEAIILNLENNSYDVIIVTGGLPEIIFASTWQPNSFSAETRTTYLTDAVERAVAFYNSEHTHTPLSANIPAFVTGALSTDSELISGLEARLGIPVESPKPPFAYPDNLPVSQYAANLGLALKDKSLQANGRSRSNIKPDINFLPEAYRTWRLSSKVLMYVSAILIALASVVFMVQLTTATMSKTANLDMRHQLLNAELLKRQTEIKNRVPLQKTIDSFRTITNMDGNYAPDIRFIIEEAALNNVQISSILYGNVDTTVHSQSDDEVSFRAYISALEKSGRFASISPPPEGYPFATGGIIKIKLKTAKPAK